MPRDWSKETDSKILAEAFRDLAEEYSLAKKGDETELDGIENVVESATELVKRILELGEVTFQIDQMKTETLGLLRECLAGTIRGGPYLDPPHGELIWTGKKQAIVYRCKFDRLTEMGLLSSGNLAYGFVRCYESEQINKDEFVKRFEEHRTAESEVGQRENLYYYKIREFIPFENPKEIGPIRMIESIKFFESTFLPKDWNLQKLSDAEIIKLHAEIHGESAGFSQETGKPPHEGIIDKHTLIIEEMRRRKLEHRPVTELDRLSLKFVTETKDGLDDKVKLSELMNFWQDGFAIRNPFLSFIGGSVVSGWGKDIDIHINHDSSDTKFLDAVNFRLQSFLPPKLKDKIHLISDYTGPFTNYVPFAILKIEMIPPKERKLIKMAMAREGLSELAESVLREQRITDITRKRQAEQSRKSDSLQPFRFFVQPKGIAGYRKEEVYSVEGAIERVKQKWMKGDKFPSVHVDQKFDGFRVQIHSDDKVKVWSEDGGDVTHRFPTIVKEAKAQGFPFVADAEVTGERKGQHIGRSDVSGYAHAKTPVDDSPYTANVFDAPYLNEDIHKKTLQERKESMKKFKSGKAFKVADFHLANTEKELKDAMNHFSEIKGSEGSMLKLWNSIYPLSGMTGDWMKFKKEADIDAEVIEIHRVKGTDSYNYLCVIRDGEKKVPVGRTYNVRFEKNGRAIMVPVGGIIRVAFVNLNRYTDPDTGEVWFNWWAPRPIEFREDKTRPDTVDTANRIVKATSGEIEEKRYPKRYEVALGKLKESVNVENYSDWLAKSFPLLGELDDYDMALAESFGEEFLNEERKKNIKECEELNLFWDDSISEADVLSLEKIVENQMDYSREGGSGGSVQGGIAYSAVREQLKDIPSGGETKGTLWEHHWRGESVHADHRFKVNDFLNGITIADGPQPGEVSKAKKTLGIEDDIDTAEKAKKMDNHFYENKLWKFDPRMPEKKVLVFPKARQPVAWLKFSGKVDPGEVGATAEGPGFLYHVEKGYQKEFGTQKTYFKEYFEHGRKKGMGKSGERETGMDGLVGKG